MRNADQEAVPPAWYQREIFSKRRARFGEMQMIDDKRLRETESWNIKKLFVDAHPPIER